MGMDALDLRIMLVEDNPEDVFITRKVLKLSGLNGGLLVAGDGREALALMEDLAKSGERFPDLILLDINLPLLGGTELLRILKNDSRFSRIPVVMLTGSNVDIDIQRSYDLGASTYLVKPISKDALQMVMQTIFPPR